jgi:hypothetical protein
MSKIVDEILKGDCSRYKYEGLPKAKALMKDISLRVNSYTNKEKQLFGVEWAGKRADLDIVNNILGWVDKHKKNEIAIFLTQFAVTLRIGFDLIESEIWNNNLAPRFDRIESRIVPSFEQISDNVFEIISKNEIDFDVVVETNKSNWGFFVYTYTFENPNDGVYFKLKYWDQI